MSNEQALTYNIDLIIRHLQALSKINEKKISDLQNVFRIYSLYFEKLTDEEPVTFTTLFSRVAFTAVKYNWSSAFTSYNHYFRRRLENNLHKEEEIPELLNAGLFLLEQNLKKNNDINVGLDLSKPAIFQKKQSPVANVKFRRSLRGIAISISEDCASINFVAEDFPEKKISVSIINEAFLKHLTRIKKHLEFPITMNLVDCEISNDTVFNCKAFVLMPDMLFGVTSISECFQSSGYNSLKYLSNKLIASESSVHMLVGNIVNFYLDELIHNPEIAYEDLLSDTFKLAPIQFASMSNEDLKDLLQKTKIHFENLQRTVQQELAQVNIQKEKSYLEPSFYSNEYGMAGRLDLYHYQPDKRQSDIVELKSGKLYKTNAYGLNTNHYMQTLLYDLIIESVYRSKVKSNNYILYSSLESQNLKYAPKVRKQQLKAIQVRNELVILEKILSNLGDDNYSEFLNYLDPKKIDSSFNFLRRDASNFYTSIQSLSELELAYYTNYVGFVSREFQLAKTGEHGIHKSNGLASIWLDPLSEKQDNFRILSFLRITNNKSNEEDPIIHLDYTEKSNMLSRFRPGDIVVFYPFSGTQKSALHNQVFKSTITEINNDKIVIRLRARQKNFDVFNLFEFWHLEGDVLDGGFRQQLHGLFHFIKAPKAYKNKILALEPPQKVETNIISYSNDLLTEEQKLVISKAIMSPEYFLLWGPPGTGKTSIMISSLVDYYYNNTTANILLLAYTNRAVDEICNAIVKPTQRKFIRLGSRYSTHSDYQDLLLKQKIESLNKRKELKNLFEDHRVFVSTVSSFQGRMNVSKLKSFDLVIVDEASQLLEPMMVGLLSRFKKFILIGDHKQLPAVVTQADKKAFTQNKLLNEKVGISDLRISLFERLYKACETNAWNWAIGALMHQGRMHEDILNFVSPTFYNDSLKILDQIPRLTRHSEFEYSNKLEKDLTSNRMLFIDTPIDDNLTLKTNTLEADIVVQIIKLWIDIYKKNNKEFTEKSVGVITPFRSQIALIKKKLESIGPIKEMITVDTIERYQGGARDNIIFSLAVNQANVLDQITNVSEEGIDRKLNVALTRAKEHIVILGTEKVMRKNSAYRGLIEFCNTLNFESFLENKL